MKNICLSVFLSLFLVNYSFANDDILLKEFFSQNFYVSEPLNIAEIESCLTIETIINGVNVRHEFGVKNLSWARFKKRVRSGDRLYHVKSDEKSWKSLSGREAIILIRGNKIIATFIVGMS